MVVRRWLLGFGLVVSAEAHAQCNGGFDATATCGSVFFDQLQTNTWTCGNVTSPNTTCPDCFDGNAGTNGQDSQLGEGCDFAPGVCAVFPMNCNNGPGSYTTCPGSAVGNQPQEGPEHVYRFVCPAVGAIDVDLAGLDCDLDLYVLNSTCSPSAGCVITDNDSALDPESVSFTCGAVGQVFYVVVEGFGFTEGGRDDGNPVWCDPHLGLEGNYTLTFDGASPGCQVAVPEVCGNGLDDDADGLSDCLDPDCPDADSDGYADLCDACPGFDDDIDPDNDGGPTGCDPCPFTAFEADADADGDWSCTDCDDTVALLNLADADGDGLTSCDGDCNDANAGVQPGAAEIPDGVDQDCDSAVDETTTWYDDDGDGYAETGGDCDDTRAAIFPAAVEVCDLLDQDCDLVVDEGTACHDDDGDGYSELVGDCHDGDPSIHPGATEVLGNGIDDDCDGDLDPGSEDTDGDGWAVEGGDCEPNDPDVHPGAAEEPDGEDDDCDGLTDEGTELGDDDGDGQTEAGGDCHDGDGAVYLGATEIFNWRDDDCDGLVDEGTDASDDDGDGASEVGGDCDDADPLVNGGAVEQPNGLDDDCDGQIDEGQDDLDGDGWSATDGDCDDTDGWTHPQAVEFCDGVDNNCDDAVDEGCDTVGIKPPKDSGCGCAHGAGSPWAALLLVPLLRRARRR